VHTQYNQVQDLCLKRMTVLPSLTKPTAAHQHEPNDATSPRRWIKSQSAVDTAPMSSTTPSTSANTATMRNVDDEVIAIPNEFICPITLELMRCPMASRYGHTYERDAIVQWISSGNEYCPLTRKRLSYLDIIPHRKLETKIVGWKAWNKIMDTSRSSSSSSLATAQEDRTIDFVGVLHVSSQQRNKLHSIITDEIRASQTHHRTLRQKQQQQQEQPEQKDQKGPKVNHGLRGLFRLGRLRSPIKSTKQHITEDPILTEASSSSSSLEPDMDDDAAFVRFHDRNQRRDFLKALEEDEQSHSTD
jgi:hypothetical protein